MSIKGIQTSTITFRVWSQSGFATGDLFSNGLTAISAGTVANPQLLEQFLVGTLASPGRLRTVQAGDYVYVNSAMNDQHPQAGTYYTGNPQPSHGFVVVGWGPMISCEIALDTEYQIVSSITQPPAINHLYLNIDDAEAADAFSQNDEYFVPYVSDFSGPPLDRVQPPIPRPFYCTRFADTNAGAEFSFGPYVVNETAYTANWYFFELPDYIQLSTQLYVDLNWTWTDQTAR